jgi:hypothetical protein
MEDKSDEEAKKKQREDLERIDSYEQILEFTLRRKIKISRLPQIF